MARIFIVEDDPAVALGLEELLKAENHEVDHFDNGEDAIVMYLGDVLDYGDNLKGDTINIAARIQQFAEPGSTCISDAVRNVIARKIRCSFTDLGEPTLKNISQPIRIWEIHDPSILSV